MLFEILHVMYFFVAEIYPNKDSHGYGSKGVDGHISPLGFATVNHLSGVDKKPPHALNHGPDLDQISDVIDENSESMWSATISGKDVGKISQRTGQKSDVVVSGLSRSILPAAESAAVSYRDDFTDVSETLMVTDFQKPPSRRFSHPSANV